MRAVSHLLRPLVRGAIAVAPVVALIAACDGASSTAVPGDADAGGDGGRDVSVARDATTDDGDAGPKTTCSITRAYAEACGSAGDLNCGADGFDAWCRANDLAINSEAYRRAEALCLNSDNCDGKKRRDCEYRHYNEETPTASQEAVVAAYCETCEPSDLEGCTTRSTNYDAAKGIDSVGDIFVAAWELADGVVDEIKTKCTGSTVDAGAGCAKTFADCAADVYLARLPDCP